MTTWIQVHVDNTTWDNSPSVPPIPSGFETDKYRGISISEVTALNDSVFDDSINTTYPSRVNAVTTISGFLQGNYQYYSLPIYSNSFQSSDRFSNSQTSTPQFCDFKSIQTVFSQVTDFQIHKLVPLSFAISNHNLLLGHLLCSDVKKNPTNLTDEVLSGKILLFKLSSWNRWSVH